MWVAGLTQHPDQFVHFPLFNFRMCKMSTRDSERKAIIKGLNATQQRLKYNDTAAGQRQTLYFLNNDSAKLHIDFPAC